MTKNLMYLESKFCFLAACLFPPYVVSGSVGFSHVLYIRSLASFATASSDEKIRRLDFLYSNLKLKFTNLTVNLEVKQQGEVW